jgi:hypothetical protein
MTGNTCKPLVKCDTVALTFLRAIYPPPWEDRLLSSALYRLLAPKVKSNGTKILYPLR